MHYTIKSSMLTIQEFTYKNPEPSVISGDDLIVRCCVATKLTWSQLVSSVLPRVKLLPGAMGLVS